VNPLSDAEKVDIRRFCGYPPYGAASSGMQSWRFFQSYGLLEFRLTNISLSEIAVVRRYLGTLLALELAVPAAAANLDTDQASTWIRNKSEMGDRVQLLDGWRRRLCGFLGVPPGDALSNGAVSLVV
jgi:hypothetical protein